MLASRREVYATTEEVMGDCLNIPNVGDEGAKYPGRALGIEAIR